MRDLTFKQKKLLDEWFDANKTKLEMRGGLIWFDWSDCDFFPISLYNELEEINDTEILFINVNNYISDKNLYENEEDK